MNQRFLLALALTAIVIVVTPLLFPRQRPAALRTDSVQTTNVPAAAAPATAAAATAAVPNSSTKIPNAVAGDTTAAQSAYTRYVFSNAGAAPLAISLDSYPSRRANVRRGTDLIAPGDRAVHYTAVIGTDTIHFDTLTFAKAESPQGTIAYTATTAAGTPLRVSYRLPSAGADEYLLHVNVEAPSAPAGSTLQLHLAEKLYSNEPDTLDDMGHLAVSFRPARGDVQSVGYSKLDTAETRTEAGPINWVAVRNKYFLLAVRGVNEPFSGLAIRGMPKVGKVASRASSTIVMPLKSGAATFDIYAGPQDFERLGRLGGDLDQVNPYAGWFHGVVQPVAAVVMKVLLWMKRTTRLNYGWVLVLFGVAIRLLLWPLNQSAMRSSIKMQRLQPQIQALQKKHSDDPRKQQEAIMKVYKDHDMSPLSPVMGCLPMLLPMPVLFALYFVFNNTIEFRGVPFLWLPDISLRDPYYITPLLMGASMFLMSWIGMRNSPPNPQAKMMSYMMPVMLTAMFLNFASGLNLYYAVQNVAAIPQQWLLARERAKNPPPAAPVTNTRKRTA